MTLLPTAGSCPLQERAGGHPSGSSARRPEGPARITSPGTTRRSLEALARINAKTQAALQLAGRSDLGPDNHGG